MGIKIKPERPAKTEVELIIGRRLSSLYEVLKMNRSPRLQNILGSNIREMIWNEIPSLLQNLEPAEAYQLGQMSALYRLGLDIRHLAARPIVVRGKVLMNPWRVPVQEVGEAEHEAHLESRGEELD